MLVRVVSSAEAQNKPARGKWNVPILTLQLLPSKSPPLVLLFLKQMVLAVDAALCVVT